jgi:UDP-N-acetylmuramyl pentapeptide phosphotransferase/UDP-N-acetylglucosamine-1-phosphate transferase
LVLATVLARRAVKDPPDALLRDNHRGVRLGAVLGGPLVAAGLCGAVALMFSEVDGASRAAGAYVVILLGLGMAGLWDDLRGDERPKGFKGHIGAARSQSLTGGMVKLLAGGIAGSVSSLLLESGLLEVISGAAIVALSANLINLFDRAPGRALKVSLIGLVPLFFVAPALWKVGAAGLAGGVAGLFPFDLRERGMLGDTGANPLGAVIGLGLALALPAGGQAVAVIALLAANLASERWSFSQGIRAVRPLAMLDDLGRQKNST